MAKRKHRVNILLEMPTSQTPDANVRPVDASALRHIVHRLSRSPDAPWLHAEAARRMAERLALVRMQPDRVLDWSGRLGAGHALLRQAYPQAHIQEVDAWHDDRASSVLPVQPPWWQRWKRATVPALRPGSVLAGAAQLVWSNMQLHFSADPTDLFKQWHRSLAVDGFLMFTCLGVGTLGALRKVYAQHGWGAAQADGVDMHDLGDMLSHAGFADPVMDQETLTLTYADAGALLDDVRSLGGNAHPHRFPALRGKVWRRALADSLEALRSADGRLSLEFELVYGHAFKPPARVPLKAETTLALDDMRAMIRAGRKAGRAG